MPLPPLELSIDFPGCDAGARDAVHARVCRHEQIGLLLDKTHAGEATEGIAVVALLGAAEVHRAAPAGLRFPPGMGRIALVAIGVKQAQDLSFSLGQTGDARAASGAFWRGRGRDLV